MEIRKLHPKKQHTYILVSFPSATMNLPSTNDTPISQEEKTLLCIELDKKKKVRTYFLVEEEMVSHLKSSSNNTKYLFFIVDPAHVTIAQREGSEIMHDLTDEIAIAQIKTSTGYEYALVLKNKKEAIVASIEVKQEVVEKTSTIEKASTQLLVNKQEMFLEKEGSLKHFVEAFLLRGIKTIHGLRLLQAKEAANLMRIQSEEQKRKNTMHHPAALDFIGPGDCHRHYTYSMLSV